MLACASASCSWWGRVHSARGAGRCCSCGAGRNSEQPRRIFAGVHMMALFERGIARALASMEGSAAPICQCGALAPHASRSVVRPGICQQPHKPNHFWPYTCTHPTPDAQHTYTIHTRRTLLFPQQLMGFARFGAVAGGVVLWATHPHGTAHVHVYVYVYAYTYVCALLSVESRSIET